MIELLSLLIPLWLMLYLFYWLVGLSFGLNIYSLKVIYIKSVIGMVLCLPMTLIILFACLLCWIGDKISWILNIKIKGD